MNKIFQYTCDAKEVILLCMVLIMCASCWNATKTDAEKKDSSCRQMKTIKGLGFYFNRYPYLEMDTLSIKVGNDWTRYKVAQKYTDSLREQRYFFLNQTIGIRDTIYFKLKDNIVHAVYGFKYVLRSHASTGLVSYGCDFYELIVDGRRQTGGIVSLNH